MAVAQVSAKEARAQADEIVKAIKAHDAAWDEDYRLALTRNHLSRWYGEGRDPEFAGRVATLVNEQLGYAGGDNEVSIEWIEDQADLRRRELMESQEQCVDEIELAKASLEAANERKKSAQSAIDEGHSRLRLLARELRKPYVFNLPSPPSRQRELPLADGEEWRSVKLAEALAGDVPLKSVVLEKLGDITLGKYAEEVAKFGIGDKPKKLTRKQWDKVEAAVQDWHASQADGDEGEDGPDDQAGL